MFTVEDLKDGIQPLQDASRHDDLTAARQLVLNLGRGRDQSQSWRPWMSGVVAFELFDLRFQSIDKAGWEGVHAVTKQ
jgi:hypothetical protein